MNTKRTALLVAALLLAGGASLAFGAPPELDQVVQRWIKALQTEDIELLMSTYWPEAELVAPQPDGTEQRHRGSAEIRRFQQGGFDLPISFGDFGYSEVDRLVSGGTAMIRIQVSGPGWINANDLKLWRRGGEWRIIHQVLVPQSSGKDE